MEIQEFLATEKKDLNKKLKNVPAKELFELYNQLEYTKKQSPFGIEVFSILKRKTGIFVAADAKKYPK